MIGIPAAKYKKTKAARIISIIEPKLNPFLISQPPLW